LLKNLFVCMKDKTVKLTYFRWLFVIMWIGVIFWFSSQPSLVSILETFWDTMFRKIAHISEYFVLTYLFFRAYAGTRRIVFEKTALKSLVSAFIISMLDELYQTTVPGRSGNILDVGVDLIGIIFTIIILKYYTKKNEGLYYK